MTQRLCGAVLGKYAAYAAAAVCVFAALVLYALCGASPLRAVCVWAVAVLTIGLPGSLYARRLLPKASRPVRAAAALVCGTVSFAGVTLIACALHAQWLLFVRLLLWWAVWAALQFAAPAAKESGLPHTRLRTGFSTLRREKVENDAAVRRFLTSADGAVLMLLGAVLVLLNALWATRYAHPEAVGSLVPSQDFFWNLGNAESFLLGLPLADLRVAGVTIQYHFLTELMQAGLASMTGAAVYDTVAFYSYAPVAAAMLTSLYALGRVLWDTPCAERDDETRKSGASDGRAVSDNREAPAVCGASVCKASDNREAPAVCGAPARDVLAARVHFRALALAALPFWLCCASLWKSLGGASRFGNGVFLYTVSNQNAQATALIFAAAFLLFWELLCRAAFRAPCAVYAGAVAAFYLLTFSKSPQAGILAAAVLCALVLLAFRRGLSKRSLLAAALLLPAGFLVLYETYFASTADSCMVFSLTGSLKAGFFSSILQALQVRFPAKWGLFVPLLMAAQAFLMAPAAFAVWLWAALHDAANLLRVSGSRLVWHAAAVGGLLAYFIFDHYSMSQTYFANIGLVCMGLAALDALPALARRGQRRGRAVYASGVCTGLALTAVSVATMACLAGYVGREAPLRLGGGLPDANHLALTADEERACTWLRGQMRTDERFATNRMHTGAAMEGLSNVYSGLSGRQAYCESFKYAVADMELLLGRYREMEALFSPHTIPAQAEQLCAERGIDYLLYCRAAPGSDRPLSEMQRVYQSDSIVIYRTAPTNAPRRNKQTIRSAI